MIQLLFAYRETVNMTEQMDFQIHVITGLTQTAAQVLKTNVNYGGESIVWPKL